MAVTLNEQKEHSNITFTEDDLLIESLIRAAIDYINGELGYDFFERYSGILAADATTPLKSSEITTEMLDENYSSHDENEFSSIPEALRQAVKMLASHWYENRETTISGTMLAETPIGFDETIKRYREWSF